MWSKVEECRDLLGFGTAACITLCLGIVIPSSLCAGITDDINKKQASLSSRSVAQNKPIQILVQPKRHSETEPKRTDFRLESKSHQVRLLADWIAKSADNSGMPYIIVDKTGAKVFVFSKDGSFLAASPALVGMAQGDDSVPGIGEREISEIRPEERTTPAGRFVAWLGYDLEGKDVLWVEYDTSVSLHRVIINKPEERRLQRLATSTPKDNRITYGCINVPPKFFDTVVKKAFDGVDGIVYILPEKKSTHEIFPMYYDVD